MRLWHYKLIDVLPRPQLLAQWRELNTIFSGKAQNHILVRYALTEEAKDDLFTYTLIVLAEFARRGYKIRQWEHIKKYFGELAYEEAFRVYSTGDFDTPSVFPDYHNALYMKICYYNLYEKFLRGQDDFTEIVMNLIKAKASLLVKDLDC